MRQGGQKIYLIINIQYMYKQYGKEDTKAQGSMRNFEEALH